MYRFLSGIFVGLPVRQSILEVGETIIEVILSKLWEIIVWIFRGQNFLFFASTMGIMFGLFSKAKRIVLKKQTSLIKAETKKETSLIKAETKKENIEQNLRIDAMEEHMSELNNTLNDMRIDIIRMQILQGIRSESFSKSELSYFYNKYTKLGGNSFVSVKVQAYLEREDIK